jgi:HK97 family phage portal protein
MNFNIFRKSKRSVPIDNNLIERLILSGTFVNSNPIVLYNYSDVDFLEKGYASNLDVFKIINKINSKCNVATPYIYIDNSGVKSYKKNIKDSIDYGNYRLRVNKYLDFAPENLDLTELIKNPNDSQTWNEFITLIRIFYLVQGEAFIYRNAGDNNCAISLHCVPAHMVKTIVKGGVLHGWAVITESGEKREFTGEDINDILHLKMPNPIYKNYKNFRGMSPLLAGLKYLQQNDKGILSWVKSLENEGAKGIVSPNHPNPQLWLTPDQVIETQKAVEEKIHGSDNKNKIAVSGMPLQYTQIGLSPDALNIVEAIKFSGNQLADLWGVPAAIFESNPTYQNQKTASERLVKEVVLPQLKTEEDKFNSWLVKPFSKRDNKNYVFDYDLSDYEELRINLEDVENLLKTHTINEVRIMQGSDEIENEYADEIFIPTGMVPLSDYNIDIGL